MNIKEKILKEALSDIKKYYSDKLVILINGTGEAGKDTLIKHLQDKQLDLKVVNYSTISPVKELLLNNIWDGNKDTKGRILLHDVKTALDNYNGFTIQYILDIFLRFINSGAKILFIHVAEQENIDLIKKYFLNICRTVTLFILDASKSICDNTTKDPRFDKPINLKCYDYVFENKSPTQCKAQDFYQFNNFIRELYRPYNIYFVYSDREVYNDIANRMMISTKGSKMGLSQFMIYNYSSIDLMYQHIICNEYSNSNDTDDIYLYIKDVLKSHIFKIFKKIVINYIKKNINQNAKSKELVIILCPELFTFLEDDDYINKLRDSGILKMCNIDFDENAIMYTESGKLFYKLNQMNLISLDTREKG